MVFTTMTVQAVFQNGVLRPARPLPLRANQKVTVTVQWPSGEDVWPKNVAEIYSGLAEDDKKLAAEMEAAVHESWPRE